ncbi:FBP domain-containing protein [Nocardioides sp. LHD-245]|uniref:FBP domain-containing protein n=1 Tax=Nocardioides sp. LHD-245 TaxID=3051387 RepID=UPI0027E1248D|nr:FBP domain-containing protein [Nocardioides sp. LHD-245]
MDPVTEREIRASFVNGTRGDVKRLNVPVDLAERPWESLDFLGWIDPRAPLQAYVLAPVEGGLAGVQLRRNTTNAGTKRARMCSLCLTTHPGSGVSLMVAPRAGQRGRAGNTVGVDVCADLACSLYVRGRLAAPAMTAAQETLPVEDRIVRLQRNLRAFLGRVTAA